MAKPTVLFDLVVGVDFGTSYTGVAHAYMNDPDPSKIEVIIEWPGKGRSHERPKAPTEISYQDPLRWGYDIKDNMPRYGWFKLYLDPDAGVKAYNVSSLSTKINQSSGDDTNRSIPPGKTATDISTDYLRLVYRHIMDTLEKTKMGHNFGNLRIKFVMTTPAMWSPAAQDATRRAAEKAGFGSRSIDFLDMVSEPEAAANYTLKKLDSEHHSVLGLGNLSAAGGYEVGNQIMICDAGGGTVDIVVYEIKERNPFLRVGETIRPQGGLCGAVNIDRKFHELLRMRLGDQAHLLTQTVKSRGSLLMQSFDAHKRDFGSSPGSQDSDVYIIQHDIEGLKPIPSNNITISKIHMTHKDFKDIFNPTVNTIIRLINDLADQARKAYPGKPLVGIILVGGFGSSAYLHHNIKAWGQTQKPEILVPSPTDGWTAIAKGAVAYGLDSLHLDRRRLTCHYGVFLNLPYDESCHNLEDSFVDPFTNVRYSRDTIEWFAKMDDTIEQNKRVEIPFELLVKSVRGILPLQLVTCKYHELPTSRRDTRVVRLGVVSVNIDKVPKSAFVQRQTYDTWIVLISIFLGVFICVFLIGIFNDTFLGFFSTLVVIISGFIFGIFQTSTYKSNSNFALEMVVESASLRFEVNHNGKILATHGLDQLREDGRILNVTL